MKPALNFGEIAMEKQEKKPKFISREIFEKICKEAKSSLRYTNTIIDKSTESTVKYITGYLLCKIGKKYSKSDQNLSSIIDILTKETSDNLVCPTQTTINFVHSLISDIHVGYLKFKNFKVLKNDTFNVILTALLYSEPIEESFQMNLINQSEHEPLKEFDFENLYKFKKDFISLLFKIIFKYYIKKQNTIKTSEGMFQFRLEVLFGDSQPFADE
jgi:hypothetical protein